MAFVKYLVEFSVVYHEIFKLLHCSHLNISLILCALLYEYEHSEDFCINECYISVPDLKDNPVNLWKRILMHLN